MKRTVKEIRAMLEMFPDNMPVEFYPISDAWSGAVDPLRFAEIHFYDQQGNAVMPSDKNAQMTVHLMECKEYSE